MVAAAHPPYPIGTPGEPWGSAERARWLERQVIRRSYRQDVLERLDRLPSHFAIESYGALPSDPERYPLHAVRVGDGAASKPTVLVTGGVHGYETSGVHGALRFLETEAEGYADRLHVVVVPCVSPWGYETINRWNPGAVDPNRSFFTGSGSPEATLLMAYAAEALPPAKVHFDLHETTDTDNTEFRPALNAREGKRPEALSPIPHGFYTVAPTRSPELGFQQAVIAAVEKVTPIAAPDEAGNIIGCPIQGPGIIFYDKHALHLCGGFTEARYVTTTEVYPDSPDTTPEICIRAQVAAVRGGLDHLLEKGLLTR